MRLFQTIFLLFVGLVLTAQTIVDPKDFPRETSVNDASFEFYSRKNDVNRRASALDVKRYMTPEVNPTPVAFVPQSNGNTSNLMQFVTDPNGDVWYIASNGVGVKLFAAGSGGGGDLIYNEEDQELKIGQNGNPVYFDFIPMSSPPDATDLELGNPVANLPNDITSIHEALEILAARPKVNLTPVSFTPTASGNATNRAEFVIAPNGDIWFIDVFGDAIRFGSNTGGVSGENSQVVLNYSELREDTRLVDVYYISDIHQKGIFFETSEGIDDGATVIVRNDGKIYKRVFYESVYGNWFIDGDRTVTEAIQASWDYATNNNYEASLYPFVYDLEIAGDDPFQSGFKHCLEVNTDLKFHGKATLRLKDNQQVDGSPVNLIVGRDVQNIEISGLSIFGNTQGQQWSQGYAQTANGSGIYIYNHPNNSDIRLTNLVIKDWYSNPYLIYGGKNLCISDVYSEDCGEGGIVSNTDNFFWTNCTHSDVAGVMVGDAFELVRSFNGSVANCHAIGNKNNTSSGSGFDTGWCANVTYTDISSKDIFSGFDIEDYGTTQLTRTRNITINGLLITGASISTGAMQLSCDSMINHTYNNVKIIADADKTNGIGLQVALPKVNRVGRSVGNVVFNNLQVFGYQFGVKVNTMKGFKINGGLIRNSSSDGIWLNGEENAIDDFDNDDLFINDVTIKDCGRYAILLSDSGNDFSPRGYISINSKNNGTEDNRDIFSSAVDLKELEIRVSDTFFKTISNQASPALTGYSFYETAATPVLTRLRDVSKNQRIVIRFLNVPCNVVDYDVTGNFSQNNIDLVGNSNQVFQPGDLLEVFCRDSLCFEINRISGAGEISSLSDVDGDTRFELDVNGGDFDEARFYLPNTQHILHDSGLSLNGTDDSANLVVEKPGSSNAAIKVDVNSVTSDYIGTIQLDDAAMKFSVNSPSRTVAIMAGSEYAVSAKTVAGNPRVGFGTNSPSSNFDFNPSNNGEYLTARNADGQRVFAVFTNSSGKAGLNIRDDTGFVANQFLSYSKSHIAEGLVVGAVASGQSADLHVEGDIMATAEVKSSKFTNIPFTASEASTLPLNNGTIIYVSDTNATFLTTGFWGVENGSWTKL